MGIIQYNNFSTNFVIDVARSTLFPDQGTRYFIYFFSPAWYLSVETPYRWLNQPYVYTWISYIDSSGNKTRIYDEEVKGGGNLAAVGTVTNTGENGVAVNSVTGNIGSVTGNVTGGVTGSVGSVSGSVGGSVGSVAGDVNGDVNGNVSAEVVTIKYTNDTGKGLIFKDTDSVVFRISVSQNGDLSISSPSITDLFKISQAGTVYIIGDTRLNSLGVTGDTTVGGTLGVTGAISGATVNTGQGATEVHLMDQNLRTTDSPTFANIHANRVYGDVNSEGTSTTYKVYGAVFN